MEKGDTVHLVVGNHNMTFPISFGVWILGGIVSLGDVNLDSKSVAGQFEDTGAKFVVCIPQTADTVKKAAQLTEQNSGPKICSLGEVEGCYNLIEKLHLVNIGQSPQPYSTSNPESDAMLVFWSSGTTGKWAPRQIHASG